MRARTRPRTRFRERTTTGCCSRRASTAGRWRATAPRRDRPARDAPQVTHVFRARSPRETRERVRRTIFVGVRRGVQGRAGLDRRTRPDLRESARPEQHHGHRAHRIPHQHPHSTFIKVSRVEDTLALGHVCTPQDTRAALEISFFFFSFPTRLYFLFRKASWGGVSVSRRGRTFGPTIRGSNLSRRSHMALPNTIDRVFNRNLWNPPERRTSARARNPHATRDSLRVGVCVSRRRTRRR